MTNILAIVLLFISWILCFVYYVKGKIDKKGLPIILIFSILMSFAAGGPYGFGKTVWVPQSGKGATAGPWL